MDECSLPVTGTASFLLKLVRHDLSAIHNVQLLGSHTKVHQTIGLTIHLGWRWCNVATANIKLKVLRCLVAGIVEI